MKPDPSNSVKISDIGIKMYATSSGRIKESRSIMMQSAATQTKAKHI